MFRSRKTIARDFLRKVGDADAPAVVAMLAEDVVYTDSRGDRIAGRADCASAFEQFAERGFSFAIADAVVSQIGDQVLIRGVMSSPIEHLNAECLWRIVVHRGKVAEYQTYRAQNPPAMMRILAAGAPGAETAHPAG